MSFQDLFNTIIPDHVTVFIAINPFPRSALKNVTQLADVTSGRRISEMRHVISLGTLVRTEPRGLNISISITPN